MLCRLAWKKAPLKKKQTCTCKQFAPMAMNMHRRNSCNACLDSLGMQDSK